MSAHVISHRRPRRKHGGPSPHRNGYGRAGGWWGFALRRFGALAVTLAGLAAATWLAPYFRGAPAFPEAERSAERPMLAPTLPEAETSVELAGAPPPQAPRRRPNRGVPLDADPGPAGDDFEILSASELDAISQARN